MRNTMRRTTLALGLGLALTIAGTQAVGAQSTDAGRPQAGRQDDRGPRGRGGDRRGGPQGLFLRGITLSDAQKAQLKTLQEQDRAQMESRRAEFDQQRDAMKALREKGDTAAIRAQMTQRRTLMDQERDRRSAAIRNILTADQRLTFDRNAAAAKQREAERGQRGEGFGRRGEKGGKHGKRGQQGAADRSGR